MSEVRKKKIYMGICSTGDRIDVHTYLFRDLQNLYGDCIELVFPDNCIHRTFHDFARCEMAMDFLDTDCDAIWFLDSDVCPPKFILDLVKNHWDKWQVAGAPYPIWMPIPGTDKPEPSVLFTAYRGIVKDENGNRGITMAECPASGQEFIDALATGCMFIKREVFSKLKKPYFEFVFDHETRRIKEGEDLGFCLKLADLGIKCFVDYSMVCKHYKRVCLLDVQNYATTMSNYKVLEYDKDVRGQIQKALTAAHEQGYRKGLKDAQALIPPRTNAAKSGLILPSHLSDK